MKKNNLPNIITFSRIIITPIFLYLFFIDSIEIRILIFFLIILFELSDLFDGYLARKYNMVTNIGKILDPFADSIFRMTIFLCFLKLNLISIWFLAFCFYRDSLVLTVRIVAANNNIVFAAKRSGKIKAIVQCIGILLITLLTIINFKYQVKDLTVYSNFIMFIITVITVWSGLDYLYKLQKKIYNKVKTGYFVFLGVVIFILLCFIVTACRY